MKSKSNTNFTTKPTTHNFTNIMLQNRYQIGQPIDEGAHAKIFEVRDLHRDQGDLVIKIQQYTRMISREIKILNKIRKAYETEEKQIALPMILEYGSICLKHKKSDESP